MKNKLLYISALVLMMSNFLFAQGSTPPVNANCEGAIFIAPSASECNSTVVSFENMNVFNGCYGEAELWYKTVVPESGVLVIVTDIEGTSSSNDPAITIYQGPCGSLGEPVIDCQEGLARATFQNVGDTILITIANLLDNMTTMCIFEPTPPSCQSFENFNLGGLNKNKIEGWTNTRTSNPLWSANSGQTGSSNTGPLKSNTGNQYIYLETSFTNPSLKDQLISPIYDLADLSTPELSFFYHMHGETIGSLEVEMSEDNGINWTSLLKLTGEQHPNQADPWIRHTEDLSNFGDLVQFRFIGERGSDFTGDIALDDICIQNTTSCKTPNNINVIETASNNIRVEWLPGGSETQYIVSVTPKDSNHVESTGRVINSTSIELDTLPKGLQLTMSIRSICSAGDTSDQVFADFFVDVNVTNDICSDAIVVDSHKDKCVPIVYNLENANPNLNADECRDQGVWFKTEVPSTGFLFFATDLTSTSGSDVPVTTIFNGECGALGTPIVDCTSGNVTTPSLSPGDTILYNVSSSFIKTADMCVMEIDNQISSNGDSCSAAVELVIDENKMYDFTNATSGPDECFASGIWFSVIVPSSGNVLFKTGLPGTNLNTSIRAFSGDCGSLVELSNGCQNNNNTEEQGHEQILIQNRTPGERLFFVVNDNGRVGTVSVMAADPSIITGPITCADAVSLDISDCCVPLYFDGQTSQGEPSGIPPGINCTIVNPVWFKTIVPASGNMRVNLELIEKPSLFLRASIFTGQCGNFQIERNCSSGSTFIMTNLPAGEEVFILISAPLDTLSQETLGVFSICLTEPKIISLPEPDEFFDPLDPDLSCDLVWTGAENNDWFNANNWTPTRIPTAIDEVCILNSTSGNYPTLSSSDGSPTMKTFKVELGAELNINQGTEFEVVPE